MSRRKILLLGVAALIGGITIALMRASMAPSGGAPANEVKAQTVEVLAAARDLPTGTILKESDLKWMNWGADAQSGALYVKDKTSMTEFVGAVLRQGVHTDEPILSGRIVHAHDQGFLAAVLAPGKRAMTVSLTPTGDVAGFIFPGDRVDVLATHEFSRQDMPNLADRHVTETVLTDVRVLALDQKSDDQTNDPKVAQYATLEVTPKQAEKLALTVDTIGQKSGGHSNLTLILRSLAVEDGAAAKGADKTGTSVGPTWDNEVNPGLAAPGGDDTFIRKVHVMRGKEAADSVFERH